MSACAGETSKKRTILVQAGPWVGVVGHDDAGDSTGVSGGTSASLGTNCKSEACAWAQKKRACSSAETATSSASGRADPVARTASPETEKGGLFAALICATAHARRSVSSVSLNRSTSSKVRQNMAFQCPMPGEEAASTGAIVQNTGEETKRELTWGQTNKG